MIYIFSPLANNNLHIEVDNIISFYINHESYNNNHFNSFGDSYDFLEKNRNDITHMIWEYSDQFHIKKYEIFLSHEKLHNLVNYAMIIQEYFTWGNDKIKGGLLEEYKWYYIDDEKINDRDFLNKSRIAKLKRILDET